MNFLAQKRKKILLQEALPSSRKESTFTDFYYKEIALLTDAGSYCIDFVDHKSFIDTQGRRILKLPSDFEPTHTRDLLSFYADSEKKRIIEILADCSEGASFSTTVKMITYDQQEFWAKAMGKPIVNQYGEIVGVKGVFQDITSEIEKEHELKELRRTIASQNSRLFNYSNLVSHNLRSHANNLELSLELLKDLENPKDEKELITGLSSISEELCNTIKHLTQIATIHDKSNCQKQVSFSNCLKEAKVGLQSLISDNRVEVYTDFSEAPYIDYIPSCLTSIFHNLLHNAIQFRHDQRNPVIDVYTLENDGQICLVIKDNGSGFDVEANRNRMFNMYQTFHNGPTTRGTGLFMIKNQIEALNGTITVESEIGNGTTFRISF